MQVLVNDAGITRDRSFAKMSREQWDEVVAVKLGGPFNVHAVIPSRVESGWGRIINISSVVSPSYEELDGTYARDALPEDVALLEVTDDLAITLRGDLPEDAQPQDLVARLEEVLLSRPAAFRFDLRASLPRSTNARSHSATMFADASGQPEQLQ